MRLNNLAVRILIGVLVAIAAFVLLTAFITFPHSQVVFGVIAIVILCVFIWGYAA